MEEKTIDRAAMGRLAKALVFICGPDHPTTVALQAAAESGSERDIKNARTLFLRLKPGDRGRQWPCSAIDLDAGGSPAKLGELYVSAERGHSVADDAMAPSRSRSRR